MKKRYVVAGAGLAVAAGLLARRAGLREDLRWGDVAKPGIVTDIDGFPVHYVERGAGPAILLIHGFGGQTYSFRKIVPALAAEHRVVAVDLLGFGYSGRSASADLSHTAQVRMLASLLDRLGLERAVVAGHSMGGAVAQRFAGTFPERVASLVLIDSVDGNRRGMRRAPLPAPLLRPLLPLLANVAASRLLAASFYDRTQLTDEVREEYLRPARIAGSMDGLLKMMQDARNDAPIDFSRITQPVLIINGAHDPIVPPAAAQQLHEKLPQSRLVTVDRAAHLPMEERPDEVASAILEFLRGTSGATAAGA